jgi:hypothetical protein
LVSRSRKKAADKSAIGGLGAGLDVHKKTVAACLRVPGSHGERVQEVRTFGTTTAELLVLRDWLEAHGVTHVAMESTGQRITASAPPRSSPRVLPRSHP